MSVTLECSWCLKRYTLSDESKMSGQHRCKVCNADLTVVRNDFAQPRMNDVCNAAAVPASYIADAPADVVEAVKVKLTVINDKYIVVKKLGRGGMGTVFKAWDVSLRRYVAIKMILTGQQGHAGDEAAERFISEAQTVAKLIHPNILQVYEAGKYRSNRFIAMEYVSGGTLEEYWLKRHQTSGKSLVRQKKLPSRDDIREYLNLMKDVIRAVNYAHENNIIHRDIKPENILLFIPSAQSAVVPKISDFGLAKDVASKKNLTIDGTVVGTPVYMSPEQASGIKLDRGSDIFSIGSVLYRLCAGREPFNGKSALDVMKAVVNSEPVSPSRANKSIEKDLEVIILKAMEKDVARRYATAGELNDDIANYLKGEPIKARPASLAHKISSNIRQHKALYAGFGIAAVLLVIMAVWMYASGVGRRKSAGEYLMKADKFFAVQDWANARENYIKYIALKKDTDVQFRVDECDRRMGEIVGEKRKAVEQQKNKMAALEKEREKERAATEEVQQIWLDVSSALMEFYKQKADMKSAWEQIDNAIGELSRSIDRFPTAMGYFYRGLLYREKKDLKQAENNFWAAMKLKQDFILARLMLGVVTFETYSEFLVWRIDDDELNEDIAIAAFFAGALLDDETENSEIPEHFRKFTALNKAVVAFQDPAQHMDLLKKGYERYKSEEFLFYLGVGCYYFTKDFQEAEQYLKKALDIKPQYAECYITLGQIEEMRENADNAVQDYTKAIQINPHIHIAYFLRASVLHRQGFYDAAIADYSSAIQIKPDFRAAYNNRGNVKRDKGDLAGAIQDYNKSIEIKPNYPAYINKAYCASVLGSNPDHIIQDYTSALKLSPPAEAAYNAFVNRGSCLMRKNMPDEAIEDFSAAIQLHQDGLRQDDYLAYYNRGIAYLKKREYVKAVEDFDSTIKLNPLLYNAYYNRGLAFDGMGDADSAIHDLTEALRLNPSQAECLLKRGRLLLASGDNENALTDLQRAVELNEALRGEAEPLIMQIRGR